MNHLMRNYVYKLVRLQLIKLRLKKIKFGNNYNMHTLNKLLTRVMNEINVKMRVVEVY